MMQRRFVLCALSVLAANCAPDEGDDLPVISVVDAVTSSNGGGYNGGGYNGGGYNGGGYNGGGYNGGGYNGGGYNGGGYNGGAIADATMLTGFGMNGSAKQVTSNGSNVGLDGTSVPTFSGLGWQYDANAKTGTRRGLGLSTSVANSAALLNVHDWLAHSDTNGNTGPMATTSPAHYCAGMEQAGDRPMYQITMQPGAVSWVFQRSTGGTPISVTLTSNQATTNLYVRRNAYPVMSGTSVNDCTVTTVGVNKSCNLTTINPGDTVFVQLWNNSASTDANVTLSLNPPPGTNACNDEDDVANRLNALTYLIQCMCPPSVSVNFTATDTDTANVTGTLQGKLNLAPTWCTGSTGAPVPEAEMQMVSACYMAHLNAQGTHVPISVRGSAGDNVANPSLNPTAGELIMDATRIGMYFGNIFSAGKGCRGVGEVTTGTVPGLMSANRAKECCSGAIDASNKCVHVDSQQDGPSYDQHWEWNSTASKWWFNSQRFVVHRGPLDPLSSHPNWIRSLGRTCDVDGCGRMVVAGEGGQLTSGGALGLWPVTDSNANPNYDLASSEGIYTVQYSDMGKQPSNLSLYPCASSSSTPRGPTGTCGDSVHPITGGGPSFRQLNVFMGLTASYKPSSVQAAGFEPIPPNGGTVPIGDDYWSWSRLTSGSAAIPSTQETPCALSATDGYSNCMGTKRLTGLTSAQTIESVFQHKPGYLVQQLQGLPIDYSEAFTVAIRYSTTATSTFRIWAKRDPSSANLAYTGYQVTPIVSGGAESYRTIYLYPVYMKPETVGPSTVPQVRVQLSGPTNGNPVPDFDAAQVFVGPPPCTPNGSGFCSQPTS